MNRRTFLQASGATALLQGVLGGLSMEALASEPQGWVESRLSALSARIERLQSRAPVPIVARGLEAQGIPIDALTNLLAGMSVAQVWHASSAAEQAHPGWEPILEATMAPFARDLGTVLSALEARPQARPSRRWRRHPERLKRVIERALPGDVELFSELEPPCAFKLAEWDDGDPVVALREHYDRAAAEVKSVESLWAGHPDLPFQDSSRLEILHIRDQAAPGSSHRHQKSRAKAVGLATLGFLLLLGTIPPAIVLAEVGWYFPWIGWSLFFMIVGCLVGGSFLLKRAREYVQLGSDPRTPPVVEDFARTEADDWLFVEEVEFFMAA